MRLDLGLAIQEPGTNEAEAPKEAPKETPKEAPKEAPKEVAKEAKEDGKAKEEEAPKEEAGELLHERDQLPLPCLRGHRRKVKRQI